MLRTVEWAGRRETFFTPRNNHGAGRKLARMARKPATESSAAQGTTES